LDKKEFPAWQELEVVLNRKVKNLNSGVYFDLFELFFGGLDRVLKKLQLKILPSSLKENLNKDTRVVMNDWVLKMYAKDRREIYRKRYSDRLGGVL
jgi:hypothetical protein